MWVVVDQEDRGSVIYSYAQTAYRAYELSGIMRDGQRLSYCQVEVTISEPRTQEKWRQMLFDFLIALHERPVPKTKLNGRSNGKANGQHG